MKSIGNFLLLVLILVILGFIGWRVLKPTLFDDSANTPEVQSEQQEDRGVPEPPQPAADGADQKVISNEEAFDSTSDATAPDENAAEENFDCGEATKIMGQIYDQYREHKDVAVIKDWLANNPDVPDNQLDSFNSFVQSLPAMLKGEMPSKEKFVSDFKAQCNAKDTESKQQAPSQN